MRVYAMSTRWEYEFLQNATLDALLGPFALSHINCEGYQYVMENTRMGDRLRKMVFMKVATDVRSTGWAAFKRDGVYRHVVKGSLEHLEGLMEAVASIKDNRVGEKERRGAKYGMPTRSQRSAPECASGDIVLSNHGIEYLMVRRVPVLSRYCKHRR